jgi:hypothetical protein
MPGSYYSSRDPSGYEGGIGNVCAIGVGDVSDVWGESDANRTCGMAVAGFGAAGRDTILPDMGHTEELLGMCSSSAYGRIGGRASGEIPKGSNDAAHIDPRGAASAQNFYRSDVPATHVHVHVPVPVPTNKATNKYALYHRDLLPRAAGALMHGRSVESGGAAVTGSSEDEDKEDEHRDDGVDDQESIATSLMVEVESVDDEGSYFGYGAQIESEGDEDAFDDVLSGSYETDIDAQGKSRNAESRARKKRRLKPGDMRRSQWTDNDGYDEASEMGHHTDGLMSDGVADGGDFSEDGGGRGAGPTRSTPQSGRIHVSHASLGSFSG